MRGGAALGCWLLVAQFAVAASQSSVRFAQDGRLLIAQFTDLHLGEGPQDAKTLQLVERVLAAEKPGLAVLSGDMVSGFAFPASDLPGRLARLLGAGPKSPLTGSWYEQQWRRLVAPLQAAGVPYASILGNHDGEADLSRLQIAELDRSSGGGLSLTLPGPESLLPAAGNYWIDVLEPLGGDVAARIWMLDSGNRGCGRLAWGWSCVPAETVAWVRAQAARLPPAPSLAFVHIPLPQHFLAWNHGAANGSKWEMVGCPGVDSGMFELAREVGITAIYSGHDHNNDFSGTLEGIRLAYGRKSGYGSYGPVGGLQRGVRMIELHMGQDPAESASWIRQEDGSRQLQHAAAVVPKDRPLRQHMCALDESTCDQALGPQLCLALRRVRNTATLLAAMAGLAAALAATAVVTAVLARHVRQHLRHQRGWQRVTAEEKPPGAATV